MNKLGMHIHGIKPGIIEAVTLLQPRTITIMDPKPEDIRAIRNVSPGTFIAIRKYEHGLPWRDTNPFNWAEQNYDMCGGLADGVVAWNEPFGHDDRGSCAPLDEWSYVFLSACRQLGAMEAVVLCMATGNWTGADDRYKITDDFPLTCSSARYFGPHEYSWPTLQAGAGWYALRFKAWIEDLEAIGRDDFSFIISEAGLTQAVIAGRDDVGWRSGGPEGVTEDSYIATIDWYNARLCEDWRVLGCCLYDWAGSHYGWASFEQLGLEQRIFQIQAPEIPEPPEPPPNGDEPMIRVFDMNRVEQDEQWARDKYGVAWRRYEAAVGQKVYRLVELREKTGTHSLITKAIDENGDPIKELPITFYWGDAPLPPDPPTEVYAHDWYNRFIWGRTNANGDVGPGMGTGAYHGWGEGGPHAVWIHDADIPSDICEKLGMMAGTFHDHLDQVFQLEVVEEPPENGDLLAAVLRLDENVAKIWTLMKEGYEPPGPPPPPEQKPFRGEYFNNIALSGTPLFTRDDKEISFEWGSGSPDPRISNDNFSVRWTGVRTFEGPTVFHVRADDGVRLYIGNQLVINQWHDQSTTDYEVRLPLTAGEWDIRLDYYEHGGGSTIKLWWQPVSLLQRIMGFLRRE